MGTRGPAPKPSNLKLVEGTYREDRAPAKEPRPEVQIPSCPSWLHREAKREWRRIVGELEALGLISNFDRGALAAYCEAYAEWWEADRTIKEEGRYVRYTTKSGGEYVQAHPAVAIKNNAIDRLRRFANDFGMTPAARARVEAAEREEGEPDPSEEFFRKLDRRTKK